MYQGFAGSVLAYHNVNNYCQSKNCNTKDKPLQLQRTSAQEWKDLIEQNMHYSVLQPALTEALACQVFAAMVGWESASVSIYMCLDEEAIEGDALFWLQFLSIPQHQMALPHFFQSSNTLICIAINCCYPASAARRFD